MDCRSQVTLEALAAMLGFIAFIGVLVHAQAEALGELPSPQLKESRIAEVFGKSRSPDANFTRWFR